MRGRTTNTDHREQSATPGSAFHAGPLTTHDAAAVLGLLALLDVHFLTLTGPACVGITRLALRVAKDMAGDYAGGIAFVPLAAIRDPNLIVPTIAHALGLREASRRLPTEQLVAFLCFSNM
jgi:predicted ATPase